MTRNDIAVSRPLRPVTDRARFVIAALLMFAAWAGSANAEQHRDFQHRVYRGDGRGHGNWGGGYYPPPPVIYGSPYYAPPPVVYAPGIGINLPGISIGIP